MSVVFRSDLDYTVRLSTLDRAFVLRIRVNNLVGGIWDKVLAVVLALAILGTLGVLAYSITNPFKEPLTEFYLLGLSGEAEGYPGLLTPLLVGKESKVVVGVINREYEVAAYRMEVWVDGVISSQTGPITLEHDEKWEGVIAFTSDRAGDKQKVEFLLYKQGQSEAYRGLHLWLDVW